ncbi:ABC transporter permease [Petroclostridium sp. X23]|uniref:ABC transporter permease n=1 Tax=Petroclostridium sp. X23 TaxID=3045146 RepID=UPI0024AE215A|nr:ABC transporter permease [Petroclostridium sp. X23]WHH57274.1 ABC transporter permease [Petroclostridium sp. X23]
MINKIIKHSHILALLFVLVVVIAAMSIITPYFFSVSYLVNATRFIAEVGFIALGMTLVILIGGIDLSVGSVVALSAVSLGMFLQSGMNEVMAVVMALVISILAGLANGLIVSKMKIPPIIVTLATMAVYRGIAIGMSSGHSFRISEKLFFIGQGYVLGLPVQFLLLIAALIFVMLLLHKTNLGLNLIAIGYNEEASKFSGLNINKEKITVYILSAFFSAVAGIIFASRVTSAKADFGTGYELDAITMSVLGGASLAGGKVSIVGTFLGATIVILLRLGLTTAVVPSEVQSILIGAILIGSVSINSIMAMRKKSGVKEV